MYGSWKRWLALTLPVAGTIQIAACGLSDQQLTQVLQSVVSTGLNSLVSQAVTTLVDTVAEDTTTP